MYKDFVRALIDEQNKNRKYKPKPAELNKHWSYSAIQRPGEHSAAKIHKLNLKETVETFFYCFYCG